MNNMNSVSSIRIHLESADDSPRNASFDFDTESSMLPRSKSHITTNPLYLSSISLDGQRAVRFSSLSSSYAQFLKQRDTDKNKKTVSLKTILYES